MGKKFNRLRDVFGAGLVHIKKLTAVVVRRMTNVPAIAAVWRPGALQARCFMHHDLGALRRQRRHILVESSVELCFCRDARVDC